MTPDRGVEVIYTDAELVVVDKPAGITVIPEAWQPNAPCLIRTLEGEWGRLWVVHRVDRDTTGIVVFARSAEAHRALNGQFASHSVKKTYHCIVIGSPPWDAIDVDAALRPDGDSHHRTVVDSRRGKPAATSFRVLERFTRYALIEARPATGRTHQIRVHAAFAGCPIVADPLYGDGAPLLLSSLKRSYKAGAEGERPLLDRTALHASGLELLHPATLAPLVLAAPYPRDLRAALAQLERSSRR